MAKREANILVTLRDRASSGLRRLGGVASGLAKSFGLVTAAATAVGTLLGVGFLRGAIRSAGEFDEAMDAVAAVTGAASDELAKLRDTADEAAARTRFTATEAANGLEELARAGLNAQQATAALNPVLDLAAGNAQSVAESAIQVTTSLNAFGLAADQAGRVSDVYTRAAQRSAQTTAQLGEAMTFVAPVARQAGLDIEQTAALIGRLADAGFRGSRGGTALRNALSQLQDPTSSFSRALREAGIQSTNFIEVVEQLAGGGERAEAAIRALGLEAAPAIQALVAGGVPALRELIGELERAGGASQEAAAAMADNLPGALDSLSSALDQARRRLVAPLVERLTTEVQNFAARVRDFTNSGVVDRFASLLVSAFDATKAAVVEFLGQIDFAAAQERIVQFAQNAGQTLREFATDAGSVRARVSQVSDSLARVVGAVGVVVNGLAIAAQSVTGTLVVIVRNFVAILNTVTGGFSESLQRAQLRMDRFLLETGVRLDQLRTNFNESFDRIINGWQRVGDEAETSAARQERAFTETEETARRTAAVIGLTAEELARFREESARNSAALASWDRTLAQTEQTTRQTTVTTAELGNVFTDTTTDLAALGEAAGVTAAQHEDGAARAVTAWLDLGAGLEEVQFRVEELRGTANTLEQLREQAEASTPAFERLQGAIEAAGNTQALELIIGAMNRLQEAGQLTEDQVRALTQAIVEQADALERTDIAADQATDSLSRVGDQAQRTARDVDAISTAAGAAAEETEGFSGSFFGLTLILERWREVGPEARRLVDDFTRALSRGPTTISRFTEQGGRFLREMEERFGPLNDALRDANDQFDRLEDRASTAGDSTLRTEQTIRVIHEVQRDPQGPLVLSEPDIDAIVSRVLAAIERDGARAGAG